MQLPHGLRVLHRGLGGPGPRLDVAALLKLKHEASISDDGTGGKALQNTLNCLPIKEYLVNTKKYFKIYKYLQNSSLGICTREKYATLH